MAVASAKKLFKFLVSSEGDKVSDETSDIIELVSETVQEELVSENLEKKVFAFNYELTNFKLYKAPLTEIEDNFIRKNQNSVFFLNQKNWI